MKELKSLTNKLYLLAFLQGFVLWYAVDKLFQIAIGLTTEQILIVGAIAQTSVLLFEIPSSIFADRRSRRLVLIGANIVFIASSFVLGASNSINVYVVGVLLWALSEALFSGVSEAFAYDSLGTINQTKIYRKVASKMEAIQLSTMALAGLSAGFVSITLGFPATFYLSMMAPVVAIMVLLKMKEPPITRTSEQGLSWAMHLGSGLKIMARPAIIWPIIGLSFLFCLASFWYEYYQLIGVETGLPVAISGMVTAVLTVGLVLGALFVNKFAPKARIFAFLWTGLIAVHILLPQISTYSWALTLVFIGAICMMALEVYLETYVQDHIPSSQRATVSSLVSLVGRVCFLLLFGIFLLVSRTMSIRASLALIAIPTLLFGVISVFRRFKDYTSS